MQCKLALQAGVGERNSDCGPLVATTATAHQLPLDRVHNAVCLHGTLVPNPTPTRNMSLGRDGEGHNTLFMQPEQLKKA